MTAESKGASADAQGEERGNRQGLEIEDQPKPPGAQIAHEPRQARGGGSHPEAVNPRIGPKEIPRGILGEQMDLDPRPRVVQGVEHRREQHGIAEPAELDQENACGHVAGVREPSRTAPTGPGGGSVFP